MATPTVEETPHIAVTAACALGTVVFAGLAYGQVHPTADPHVAWWILAVLFALCEVDGVGMARDRYAVSSPMARIPLVIGLYLAAPLELIVAQVLGTTIASAPRSRTSPRRVAFVATGAGLSATAGAWAYLAMTGLTAPHGPQGWADGMVAAAAAVGVSTLLGAATSSPRGSRRDLGGWVVRTLGSDVLAVATGLVAAEILRTDRYAAWLLVLPTLAAYAVRHQYELAGWRGDALTALHHVAQRLQRAPDRTRAVELAVAEARAICRAAGAEVVLRGPDGTELRRGVGQPAPPPSHPEEGRDRTRRPSPTRLAGSEASPTGPLAGRWRAHLLVTPVLEAGATRGHLALYRPRGRPFSTLEIQVAETLTASLGAALETLAHLDGLAARNRHAVEMLEQREQVNAELHRVSEAKSVFLATTSHELRAPLGALLAETELLAQLLPTGTNEHACRGLIRGARANTEHLQRLVDDLLDLSRIEAGQLELQPEMLDLREVAEDVVAALRPVVGTGSIVLSVGGATHVPFLGDRGRLWQILANLVHNAARASAPGDEVRVEVAGGADVVELRVVDDGCGIAPGDLERMFAAFERRRAHEPGLGLGLTIARHLVEAHGGVLQVDSVLGVGSCFTATLPSFPPAVTHRSPGLPEVGAPDPGGDPNPATADPHGGGAPPQPRPTPTRATGAR